MNRYSTYGYRIKTYKRRVHVINWFGAGVGALIMLISGEFFAVLEAPSILKASIPSIILLCGVFLGYARIGYEWEATLLERMVEFQEVKNDELLDAETYARSNKPELYWNLARVTFTISGILLVLATWWKYLTGFQWFIKLCSGIR